MNTLLNNLRYALRQLRKSPGFTLTVVLTLALGVGAITAIYTVVYATLLAPLPYPQPDQLVVVWSKIQGFRNVASPVIPGLEAAKQRVSGFKHVFVNQLQYGGQG